MYAPRVSFDGNGPAATETFGRRRDQLLEFAAPLFDAVIEVARGGDEDAYELLVELLDELAVNPYASGLSGLIDQTRFVPAVAFHIAGVAACWAGRDKLVGMLLMPERTVTEPARGAVPMAYGFRPYMATHRGQRDFKQLHDDLAELLSGVLNAGTFHRAWEAWAYLCAVANVHFRAAKLPADSSWPYLQVKDLHLGGGLTTVTAARVRARLDKLGDAHPMLQAGFCGGSHELFTEAGTTFESNYGQAAETLDWQALPPGGGVLPSGPHYPGER